MRFPFASFSVGFVVYFLLIALFAFVIFRQNLNPQISLEIDADLIGEVVQHEKSKTKNTPQKNLEKISQLEKENKNSAEEKLEPHEANADKESQHDTKKIVAQKLAPINQPLPEIPEELRYEAFNSYAIARFYVATDGTVTKVELIKPCNNPRLNQLLLKSLKNWKFNSGSKENTKDIKVTFKVE